MKWAPMQPWRSIERALRSPRPSDLSIVLRDFSIDLVRDGLPYRRYLHRQPRAVERRRTEGRKDDGVRSATEPSGPGLRFHRLDRARDPNFWSVRVSDDIRLIVHRTATSLLLCYVGHHDTAYAWAERRGSSAPGDRRGAARRIARAGRDHRRFAFPQPTAPPAKPLLFAWHRRRRATWLRRTAEWLARCAGPPRTPCSRSPAICRKRRPRRS